jgi:RNA polymerase I-specific transcription initiation factor RRN6
VRSHRNWLLKSHPQALLGGPDLGALLSQEIRGLKDADAAPPVSSLLALGEITDLREAIQVTSQPAIAFASGEGGHILQILTLTPDERGWDDEGLALRFGTTQSSGRGQWIEDGNPITMIKFAVDPQKYDPIRWIIVQKITSTIILEPEIRKTPLKGNRLRGVDSRATLQISANPLFAISADKTGGGSQSDVSFNPASSGAPPQLAIINKTGYWSIWDVTGNRSARPKVLRPVLRVCGSMDSGPIPALPLGSRGNQTVHRVSWLFQSKEASPQDQNYSERTPRLLPRADHILACNDTALRVISIADGKFQTGLSVARPGKAERILDVRICPFDASKAFVLTTTTLFWVSNEPAGAGGVRLAVIISSPHYKKPNDETLRLGVSPGIDLGHTLACFVCVYSSADAQASAFWFTKPTAEGPAQFFYRTIYLDGPAGLNSMALSLLPSLYNQSGKVLAGDRKSSALHLARFFQMFILGPDMGLGSSVIAWSPFPFGNVEPPTTTSRLEQSGSRRKKLMLHLGEAFVVPDGFDDHDDASPGGPSGYTTASGVGERKTNRRTTTDFTFLSTQLQQLIRDQASRESAVAQLPVAPLPAIRAVIEASIAKDHSSFHLL